MEIAFFKRNVKIENRYFSVQSKQNTVWLIRRESIAVAKASKIVKSKTRARRTDVRLENPLRIASSQIHLNIEKLVSVNTNVSHHSKNKYIYSILIVYFEIVTIIILNFRVKRVLSFATNAAREFR